MDDDNAIDRRTVCRANVWLPRVPFIGVMLLAGAATAQELAAGSTEQTNNPAGAEVPAIVCLHTEYLPLTDDEQGLLPFRLVRELGRQAVLIAARDGLGCYTRDETLGEPFPEAITQSKNALNVKVRCYFDGTIHIDLAPTSAADRESDASAFQPPEQPDSYDTHSLITSLAKKLESMGRGELIERLQTLGISGEVPAANLENAPPDTVEGWLLQMNFVSQFAVVRAAHAAIRENGESAAWLGVLARGYANLALMTQHHWKSNNEAFAARALLYGERMVHAAPQDIAARAHRAYVRAIVGVHGAALNDLEEIAALKEEAEYALPLPAWFELVGPFCSFEREPLIDISARRASLRQLAERLSFEQHRAFGDDRWLLDSARRTMGVCPDEYGIYAALAVPGAPLGVGRMGAYYAPAALGHFLPQRLATLPELPEAVQNDIRAAAGEEQPAEGQPADDRPGDPNTEDVFSIVPTYVAEDLQAATKAGDDTGEPSWAVLGDLIAEEQFVQAANYLQIATNATESSLAEDVAGVLPMIKGHRYARYVASYSVNMRRETARFYEVIGDLPLLDPRGNMQAMFYRTWRAPNEAGQNRRGYDAAYRAFFGRNLTYPGMFESYDRLRSTFWSQIDRAGRRMFARDFQRISPNSPQALRLEISLAGEPTYEKVAEWEGAAGEDPQVFVTLGQAYRKLQHFEDAIRCFERSIELSPTKDAFVALADAHRAADQEDLWQPTLERFFEVESMGLEHAQVHSMIARDLMAKDKLDEAEPHATEAAQTWASWGLSLASEVYEGLGRWEESEQWMRENSTSYPTSSGDEWYFWCRRTGRGDADEARKLSINFYTADWIKTSLDGRARYLVFHLLEGDVQSAFEEAQAAVDLATSQKADAPAMVYYRAHLALIAHELKNSEVERHSIAEIKRLIDEHIRKDYVDFSVVIDGFCQVLEGKTLDGEALARIDEHLGNLLDSRCNCEYFLGRAFDLHDKVELADKYWKRAVERGPYTRFNATLAGKYLSARYGTSRP